jgi:hypothetical protein
MQTIHSNLNVFFVQTFEALQCDDDTRAYISSVFGKFRDSTFDYSGESITLVYAEATFKQDFLTFQNIGDWLFFCNTMFPEYLKDAPSNYYCSIAQLSYYSCYRLINRQWKLYEKLADEFIPLSRSTRQIIQKL